MRLAPISWLCHVSGTKKGEPPENKHVRCVEMEVKAENVQEACALAVRKAESIGYISWGVKASPLRNGGNEIEVISGPVLNRPVLPHIPAAAVPPEEEKKDSFEKLLSDYSFFYYPAQTTKNGRSIESDSCP